MDRRATGPTRRRKPSRSGSGACKAPPGSAAATTRRYRPALAGRHLSCKHEVAGRSRVRRNSGIRGHPGRVSSSARRRALVGSVKMLTDEQKQGPPDASEFGREEKSAAAGSERPTLPCLRGCSCDDRRQPWCAADPELRYWASTAPTSSCVVLAGSVGGGAAPVTFCIHFVTLMRRLGRSIKRGAPPASASAVAVFRGASSGAQVRAVSLIGCGSERARGAGVGTARRRRSAKAIPANRAIGNRIAASCIGLSDRHLRLGFTFLPLRCSRPSR